MEIKANVLEYSSDMLRAMVDQRQIRLPWDIDMLREFQGQTYVMNKNSTDAYGKKQFNKGKFHALDAARMAVLGHLQERIDAMKRGLPRGAGLRHVPGLTSSGGGRVKTILIIIVVLVLAYLAFTLIKRR